MRLQLIILFINSLHFQISRIDLEMPNKHYFSVDLSVFPTELFNQDLHNDVYLPADKPSGYIFAELYRKQIQSNL